MSAITSHNRKFLIAGVAFLAFGAAAYSLARFYPALGPVAGAVAPQLYVDSVAGAQIPARGPYVLVDAASARLYMIDDGRVQDSMRVIVGKPDTPTPALKDVLNYETLNPYWHVTGDLTRTLIAPNVLKQGDPYLTSHGYEVLSGWGPDARVLSPDSVDWKAVAAGAARVGEHLAAAEELGLAVAQCRASPRQLLCHPGQRLVEVASVQCSGLLPTAALRQQAVRHRAHAQGRMPQRDRHAGAEQRAHALRSRTDEELARVQRDVAGQALAWHHAWAGLR